jgi:hypothetical protein
MKKWPTSGWAHAGVGFVSASVVSLVVGYLTYRNVLTTNIRTDPQYGAAGRIRWELSRAELWQTSIPFRSRLS